MFYPGCVAFNKLKVNRFTHWDSTTSLSVVDSHALQPSAVLCYWLSARLSTEYGGASLNSVICLSFESYFWFDNRVYAGVKTIKLLLKGRFLCAEEPKTEPKTGYCCMTTTQLTVERSVRLISDSENTRRPALHSEPLNAVAIAEHEDVVHPNFGLRGYE